MRGLVEPHGLAILVEADVQHEQTKKKKYVKVELRLQYLTTSKASGRAVAGLGP